jgi:hypothetical protein
MGLKDRGNRNAEKQDILYYQQKGCSVLDLHGTTRRRGSACKAVKGPVHQIIALV